MIVKLSALALAFPAVVSAAITLNTPSIWIAYWTGPVKWTSKYGDPTIFSLELDNPAFTKPLNVTPGPYIFTEPGSINIEFPVTVLAGAGYTLVAFNFSDRSVVYSTTGTFTIVDPLPVGPF